MVGFVKDFNTFETLKTVRPISWDVVIESFENEQSTITVPRDDADEADSGRWLIFGEALLLIQDVQIETDLIVLKCTNLLKAFDRTMRLEDVPYGPWTSMTTFVMDLIDSFKKQSDSFYAMPYLSISGSETVTYVAPETDSVGCFSVLEFLTSLKKTHGIRLVWSAIGPTTLGLSVDQVHASQWTGGQIVLGAGRDQLVETPTFATADVAKVTVFQPQKFEDDTTVVNSTDYFLFEDGTFGTDASAGVRVSGSWKTVSIAAKAEADEIAEKVASTFQRGIGDAKICFFSEKNLAVGAPINLRVGGRKYSGYVASKRVSSNDERFVYQVGNKAVTLTERVRRMEAQQIGATSQSEASTGSGSGASVNPYPVGSIYLSVVSTSPAELFGGTWERLKDRFLLAAGDTYAANATGGEAEHTLTEDEMPSHKHIMYVEYSAGALSLKQWGMYMASGSWGQIWEDGGRSGFSTWSVNAAGGSAAHNNMPPYLAVYMWRRTA